MSQVATKPDSIGELPPFDYKPAPYVGPSKEEVLALRKEHLSPGTRRSMEIYDIFKIDIACSWELDIETYEGCGSRFPLTYPPTPSLHSHAVPLQEPRCDWTISCDQFLLYDIGLDGSQDPVFGVPVCRASHHEPFPTPQS